MPLIEPTASVASMQAQFSSIAEYLDATAKIGWDQQFRQLDRQNGPASIKLAASKKTQLTRVQYSNLIHQQITPPKDCINFGILAQSQAPLKLGKSEVQAESLMHFGTDSGLDAVVQAGFHAYTLSFSKDHLLEMAERHELALPDNGLGLSTSASEIGTMRTHEIRQLIKETIAFSAHPQAIHTVLEAMESTLPLLILQSWYDTSCPLVERLGNRPRILGKALAYIDSHPKQAVSVEQLCLISASSISTLERAFKEQFGVSPKRYLVATRLSGAHRALLDRNDTRSITDIAFDWSFWHMGKFASDYKIMFGQVPSQTRQSSRQTAT